MLLDAGAGGVGVTDGAGDAGDTVGAGGAGVTVGASGAGAVEFDVAAVCVADFDADLTFRSFSFKDNFLFACSTAIR